MFSFSEVTNYKDDVSENYHNKLDRAIELYVYPFIKNKPIEEIKRLEVIDILTQLSHLNPNNS